MQKLEKDRDYPFMRRNEDEDDEVILEKIFFGKTDEEGIKEMLTKIHRKREKIMNEKKVIFKEFYYCRIQMKTTPMKRGLNADFKNVKIIWGSKNFFSQNF